MQTAKSGIQGSPHGILTNCPRITSTISIKNRPLQIPWPLRWLITTSQATLFLFTDAIIWSNIGPGPCYKVMKMFYKTIVPIFNFTPIYVDTCLFNL